MAKQKERTAEEIKEHVKRIQEAIEKYKREKKEENFTYITPEEIENKLKRVTSPIIFFQGFDATTVPGNYINYSLGIYNPDPFQAKWLFGHVWVGSGNIDPTVGTFLLNADPQFPRLTQPAYPGLTLPPSPSVNSFARLAFVLNVPNTAQRTNYLGNSCLMRFSFNDIGQYLDRAVFVFGVV